MDSKFKVLESIMKHMVISLLLLSNCGLVVRGFALRSCEIFKDKAICSKNKLTEVPQDIPPSVESIDLSSNKISKIQVLHFTHFPIVTTLDLKQNSIWCIGKSTFSQLFSLKRLILNSNKIVRLNDDTFDGLPKLIELMIGFNRIETVAPNAFRSLNSLKVLELSCNKLRRIAQVHLAIQHMPHLKNLQIRKNEITTFTSQDLTNTSINITYLDLSENPLEKFEITAAVFPKLSGLNIGDPSEKLNLTWAVQNWTVLSHVTTLDVSGVRLASNNERRKLFSTFNSSLTLLKLNSMKYRPTILINMSCSIPTVSGLQLQKNKFNYISSNLFQMCHRVTELDLERNNIKLIQNGSFAFLQRLRVLSLSRNKLPSVPFAMRNLHSLLKLDLGFNRIKVLECQDFANLSNLIQLNLQWNSVTALSKCTFVSLSKLEVLKLQGNSIAKLGSTFKISLPSLKVLHLNQNKLTVITESEFRGLRSLVNMSLFQNQINSLEKDCFSGLKSLMFLQLQMNELKKEALDNARFKDLVNLRRLDLGNNHLKYWSSSPLEKPPFIYLSRLETLIFSVQRSRGMALIPSNFLQGLTSLLTFISNNIQLLSFPDDFFTHTPQLTTLDISANYLMDVSPRLFSPIPNLTRLRIGSTNLRSLDFLIAANLTKLKYFEARKNAFSVISEDIVRSVPGLLVLDLKYNSFMCDCDNSWFIQWVQSDNQTQVVDAHSFKCNYPPHSRDTELLHLNIQSCLIDVGFICFISTTCVTVLTLLASFTYHFSRYQLTYAYYIFLAWLFDAKNRNKRAASEYDAFVSYNTHDEAWVYGELLPRLEQEQGWKLCLHHRDFLPGKPIVENIADAIYGSRKTISVISRRYLQSEWCSKEMQLARYCVSECPNVQRHIFDSDFYSSFRLFDEREDVLILVFLEDIPTAHLSPYYRMRKVLKRRTYLSWPRAREHQQLFWEKLRQALRSINTAAEDRLLLTVGQTP